MAEATVKKESIDFSLRLRISPRLRPECSRSLYNEFLDNLSSLNTYFCSIENLEFIHVKDVCITNEYDIDFTFTVDSEEKLDLFFLASQSKALSNSLVDYAAHRELNLKLNFDRNNPVSLSMELGPRLYHQLKALFYPEDSDEDGEIFTDTSQEHDKTEAYARKMNNQEPPGQYPESELSLQPPPCQAEGVVQSHHEQRTGPSHGNWHATSKICFVDFCLFVPTPVASVQLICKDYKEIHSCHLEPNIPQGLWTVRVKIPADMLNRGLTYKYKSTTYGFTLPPKVTKMLSKIWSPTKNVSEAKKINFAIERNEDEKKIRSFVKRDEMRKEYTVDGFIAHCIHMLSSSTTVNDCISQLENMQPKFQLSDSLSVIKTLAKNVSLFANNNGILFAIIILHVIHTVERILDDNCITNEIAQIILQSCKTKHISQLKVTTGKRFTKLLRILCQIIHKEYFCPLYFLHDTYQFLGKQILASEILDFVSQGVVLCQSSEDINIFQELLSQIISDEDSTNSDQLLLLELLFRHLPTPLALKGFGYMCHYLLVLQKDHHQVMHNKLRATMQDIVIHGIKEAASRKYLPEIHDIWVSVKEEKDIALATWKNLQIEIIKIAKKATEKFKPSDNDREILLSLCMDQCLFQARDDQHSLLLALANSEAKLFHGLFIILSKEEKFNGCLRGSLELVHRWLETALKCHLKQKYQNKEEGLGFSYERLHDALGLLKLPDDEDCQTKLNKIFLEWLSRLDIKAVLRKLEDIERLEEKEVHIMELYQQHVFSLLSNKSKINKLEEIIFSCCGTSDVVKVNSWPTAQIIQNMMSIYGNIFGEDDLENFFNMVKMLTFWKVLISASGTKIDLIRSHEMYKKAVQCILNVLKKMESQQIPWYCMEILKKNQNITDIKELLILTSKKTAKEIDNLWNEAISQVQIERENVKLVRTVLDKIKVRIPSKFIPKEFNELETHLNNVEKKLQEGQCSSRDVREDLRIWHNCEDLPTLCHDFEPYIGSDVFWNSCLVVIETIKEKIQKKLEAAVNTNKDEETIGTLFGCTQYPVTCLLYVRVLYEEGHHQYRKNWMCTCKDVNVPVKHILNMFKQSDVIKEIKLAESILNIQIHTKEHLKRFQERHKYVQYVQAMKNVLPVFELRIKQDSRLLNAINCIDGIAKPDFGAVSWAEVDNKLKTVLEMASLVDEGCVKILQAFTEASSLVSFLREVADVDLRNLIESVEEVSEQSVNEATVSGLIDVKRFLQPLLKEEFGSDIEYFFSRVSEQSASVTPNDFVLKLRACQDNLHNLISLYRNIANRGEITRETIESVNRRGMFCFEITLNEYCVLTVQYAQRSMKRNLTQDNLIDLRSRALMLINTENKILTADEKVKKRESLEAFVKTINVASEISQLLTDLHQSGHFRFEIFQEKKSTKDLMNLKEFLEEEYSTWCEKLKACRGKYYYMNFIYGSQIYTFYTFLQNGKGHQKVLSMLRFIHPEIELQDIRKYYCSLDSDGADSTILQNMGMTLEFAIQNLQPVCRVIPKTVKPSPRITDRVMPGKLLLVTLEENSSLVARTVMALYNNTTKKLPESNQVIFCNENTAWIEIKLILQRCTRAHEAGIHEALFCIANVELLPNDLQFLLVEALQDLPVDGPYLLAVICRGTDNHPFVNEFSGYIRPVHPLSETAFENILQQTWPNVSCITSDVPGLGKTEIIKQRAHLMGKRVVPLHISGLMHKAALVERLLKLGVKSEDILHIDVGNVDNPMELDAFLFEIVVLEFSSTGRSCVHMPTSFISIEIANTIGHQLKDKLQTAISFRRENLIWHNYDDFIVGSEGNDPVQVVCHYLRALDDGTVDSNDLYFTGKKAVKPLEKTSCQGLLKKYFPGPADMSFTIARIFINSLADQLKKLSCSVYLRSHTLQEALGEDAIAVKSNLVHALLLSSSEFASRSINSCRLLQASSVNMKSDTTFTLRGEPITESDMSYDQRVKGMIRWEDSNHLIFVFHSRDIQTLSVMYRDRLEVPRHIRYLFERQMGKALPVFSSLSGSDLQDILHHVARINPEPLPYSQLKVMAKDYALTPDNLLKMVLIMMRLQAHIPVIIMGETGCGKTSLLQYLSKICEVSFKAIPIHAGIREDYIVKQVIEVNEEALNSLPKPVWLFLDEINACNHLGLICDIVCHHSCLGLSLAPNLVIMAACNPYKCRQYDKILTVGLRGKVKMDELSHLVYRVFPLPETMLDYVWDFGRISEGDEKMYIHRMIQDVFVQRPEMDSLLAELITMSQTVTCEIEGSDSCVSLRDVNRCKLLAKWFPGFLIKLKDITSQSDFLIECMILALAHCYHSRFSDASDRKKYREQMAKVFVSNKMDNYDENKIRDVIIRTQKDILRKMELPAGTAENTALQENVFVILVCILNRIPIFVVGKPGCSKSLSMQVIRSNLRGKDSRNDLFRSLPQLYCVSYQGSDSSTSDGIIKVFEKAQRYQHNNDPKEVLSVVILDEIGLAERSRFNPLKVLHSLLEPAGKEFPDVAVVGISNWALDAAKMNRAIYLSRPEMNENELIETGKSISSSFNKETHHDLNAIIPTESETFTTVELDNDLCCLAKSYLTYAEKQTFSNFHGLRDYYSLVKYIARTLSEKSRSDLNEEMKMMVITKGLQRNFGGLPSELSILHQLFKANLQMLKNTKVPVLDLIVENIQDKIARHLMLITSGDVALDIVEQELDRCGRERITIYGSQFEEDQTDDYNYRILNKIIICMEQGLVLILKDLENIYGSLYDMLNQNYTMVGETKNCRVALGPHSNSLCQVHEDFRCIVIVEESKLNHADPPFLNRFEKQTLKFADILSQDEIQVITHMENLIEKITCMPMRYFKSDDVFPIFGPDMIPSLVHKCYIEIDSSDSYRNYDEMTARCLEKLLWIMKPEAAVRLPVTSYGRDKEMEVKEILDSYLKLPIHNGLQNLLMTEFSQQNEKCKMIMVFTNSNIHTSITSLLPDIPSQVEKLGAFKSEKLMTLRMLHFWSNPDKLLLVLQCRPTDDGALILLARNTVERLQKEYQKDMNALAKHVCMIMHMDRVESGTKALPQINFLTSWKLVTVDGLQKPKMPLPTVYLHSLVEIIKTRQPLDNYIKEQLFWAFTRIQYSSKERNAEGISLVMKEIHSSKEFLGILGMFILNWIEAQSEKADTNWQLEVACDSHLLFASTAFDDALENYITATISDPLARILFELEKKDALSTFFYKNPCTNLQEVWKDLFTNPEVFSIVDTPKPTGVECYTCLCPFLKLRVPFFLTIYEKVENTKKEFLKSLKSIKSAAGVEDTKDVPEHVLHDLVRHHEKVIAEDIPEIAVMYNRSWNENYEHDFINVASYEIVKAWPKLERVNALRWCLMGDKRTDLGLSPVSFVANMHVTFWMHDELIRAELQLIEMCADILKEENIGITHILQKLMFNDNIGLRTEESALQFESEYENISNEQKYYTSRLTSHAQEEKDKETYNIADTLDSMDNDNDSFQDTKEQELVSTLKYMPENIEEEICLLSGDSYINTEGATKAYPSYSIDHPFIRMNEANGYSDNRLEYNELASQPMTSDENFSSEECFMASAQMEQEVNDESHVLSENETRSLQDEMSELHSDILVKNICRMMLPTKQTLQKYSDIGTWHQRARNLVSLASQVSMYPSTLYALRFCCDIAVQTTIPKEEVTDIFAHMGLLLQEGCHLDDQKIRHLMEQLLQFCGQQEDRLKVIAVYCSRCIGANPNTDIIDWLMDFITREFLPADAIINLKYPIHHAVTTDLNCDPNLVMDILNTDQQLDVVFEHSPFLEVINRYLENLITKNLTDSPFPVMLVDILEHDVFHVQFKDFDIEKIKPLFIQASKILQHDTFSVRYTAAVACVKSFLAKFCQFLEEKNYDTSKCQVLAQTVNAALSKSYPMRVFFLKSLGRNKWMHELQRISEKCSDQLACISDFVWKKDFNSFCIEASPISLHVSESILEFFTSYCKASSSDLIKELVKKAILSSENMACLYSIVMTDFFLKRTLSALNDTEKTRSITITAVAKEEQLDRYQLGLLECFCGTRDIKVEMLQLHPESTGSQKDLSTFIGHLLVILICFGFADGKPLSFYSMCLLNPTILSDCYIPGMPDIEEIDLAHTQAECHISRDSGKYYRYFEKDHFENDIPVISKSLTKTCAAVKFVPQKGYRENKDTHSVKGLRHLSQLTYHVLQCLLYGCLAGSIAVGFSSVEDVSTLLHKPLNESEELPDFIMEILEEHMTSLSSYLGLQQHDAVVFLHAVLHETKYMLCTDARMMTSLQERLDWEDEYAFRLDSMVKQRFFIIQQLRRKQNALYNLSTDAMENMIQEVADREEVDVADRIQDMPSIWRITKVPSLNSLLSEVEIEGKENDFQFLYLVLKNLPLIELIKNILPILSWHKTSVIYANYYLKKKDAVVMRISDFICRESDDKRREILKEKFEKYKLAITNIIEMKSVLDRFDPDFPELEHAHDDMQLKLCLCDDQHSQIYKVLSTLVSLQNRFIDESLKIAVNAKSLSLNFLRRGSRAEIQCVSLSDATSRDLISFEWNDSFLLFSHCDLRHGYGQRILHDFENIETSLANSILTNKKYLMKDDLPSIVYADELFRNYVHMVQQVQKEILQLPLPAELIEAINKKKEKDPRQVPLLLSYTGILMSLLKKTSGDPESALVDYVDSWKNILNHPLPKDLLPSPENSVKLCHIVALHELLEELNAESIIDSLGSKYRVNLNPHTKKEIGDILSRNKDLAKLMLKAVKLFVHRCLSLDDADETQVMISYLGDASFWPTGVVKDGLLMKDGLELQLCILLPDSLKVQNVYQVCQLCKEKIETSKVNKQNSFTNLLKKRNKLEKKLLKFRDTFSTDKLAMYLQLANCLCPKEG